MAVYVLLNRKRSILFSLIIKHSKFDVNVDSIEEAFWVSWNF
jgi:hypothetical protein